MQTGKLRTYSFEKPPRIFRFVAFLTMEIREKQIFTPGNSAKLCYTPWTFQGHKPRPMEILHNFFLITPENSTSFSINPRNFHMLFLQYPWKFHILNRPVWIFSGIAQSCWLLTKKVLSHFTPMCNLCTPWKRPKISDFLTFSGV